MPVRSIQTARVNAYFAGYFDAFDFNLFLIGRSVFTDGYTPHVREIAVRQTTGGGMG